MSINISMPEVSLSFPVDIIKTKYDELIGRKGVYFIYDREGSLLYIGQSKNLYLRLNHHINGRDTSSRFYLDIGLVEVYFVESDFHREISYAINKYQPSYNSSKVFYKNSVDEEGTIESAISELRAERRDLVNEIHLYFSCLVI